MLALLLVLSACSPAVPPGAIAVVEQHLQATALGDEEAFVQTLHSASPSRTTLLQGMQTLAETDFSATTESITWQGRDAAGRGLIEVRQRILHHPAGAAPTLARVRGRITVVPEKDRWLVWQVETLEVYFLPFSSPEKSDNTASSP